MRVLRGLDLNLLLIPLLCILAVAPLTYPGFFQSRSGYLPVLNLFDLEKNLPALGWVPAIAVNYGPLNGEGPLPYAVALVFRFAGLSGVASIKATYAFGLVLSALAMYALARRLFGSWGGAVSAVVYVYLPYHLAVVYRYGGLAEAWALVLYPLILWALDISLREGGRWARVLCILLLALLTLTHVGLSILFALLVLAYTLAFGRSWANIALPFLGLALGALLWTPAVFQHAFSLAPSTHFSEGFLQPYQLLSPSYGETLPRFELGVAPLGLVIVTAALAAQRVANGAKRPVIFLVSAAGLTALLIMPLARPLWEMTRAPYFLAYPWQLLALAGLCLGAAAGGLPSLEPRLARLPYWASILTLTVLASYGYLSPHFTDLEVKGPALGMLDDKVALLDYELDGPLRHGATVHLTLYWQCLDELGKDYTVFVHIVDQGGHTWGAWDNQPVAGGRPTSTWRVGELIEDPYQISIDVRGPREGYAIEVGMYLAETGERLSVKGGAMSILVAPPEER